MQYEEESFLIQRSEGSEAKKLYMDGRRCTMPENLAVNAFAETFLVSKASELLPKYKHIFMIRTTSTSDLHD